MQDEGYFEDCFRDTDEFEERCMDVIEEIASVREISSVKAARAEAKRRLDGAADADEETVRVLKRVFWEFCEASEKEYRLLRKTIFDI